MNADIEIWLSLKTNFFSLKTEIAIEKNHQNRKPQKSAF